jgi:hypothetical protein
MTGIPRTAPYLQQQQQQQHSQTIDQLINVTSAVLRSQRIHASHSRKITCLVVVDLSHQPK